MKAIGKNNWAIAEGYIPAWSHGPEPEMLSHEAVCILNAGESDAHIQLLIYYTDRDPAGPYNIVVKGKRTAHIRFNELKDPEPVPLGVPYASTLESDVPVVVQHTRLDSRQSENALLSTIAFAGD